MYTPTRGAFPYTCIHIEVHTAYMHICTYTCTHAPEAYTFLHVHIHMNTHIRGMYIHTRIHIHVHTHQIHSYMYGEHSACHLSECVKARGELAITRNEIARWQDSCGPMPMLRPLVNAVLQVVSVEAMARVHLDCVDH